VVLHVNPISNPFGGRGIFPKAIDVSADVCFYEIYSHAHRLFIVVLALFGQFGEGRKVEGWKPEKVDRFIQEYEEAKYMQKFVMTKLEEIETKNAQPDSGA